MNFINSGDELCAPIPSSELTEMTCHSLPGSNIVSGAPVKINLAEARLRVPWRRFTFEFAARLQDNQPAPDRGFLVSVESVLTFRM